MVVAASARLAMPRFILLGWVLLPLLLAPTTSALTPLTDIKPTDAELDAFASTVVGALAKLGRDVRSKTPVIHVVGASAVEEAVDWRPVCQAGASVVLVGPQVVEQREAGSPPRPECVAVVRGLYSRDLVKAALGGRDAGDAGARLAKPDLLVLLNADLYMTYWRRTLAELLQIGRPVVVTMYCEYEGALMERLFNWQEMEFTADALAQCDSAVHQAFGSAHAAEHSQAGGGYVPEARTLWEFEANPHAHEVPRECYSGSAHGTRNGHWMAFTGGR